MAAEANYNSLEDDKALCHQLLFRIQLKNFWKRAINASSRCLAVEKINTFVGLFLFILKLS